MKIKNIKTKQTIKSQKSTVNINNKIKIIKYKIRIDTK